MNVVVRDYLDFLRDIPDESVDLILTDPPFGVSYQNNYTGKKFDMIAGDEQEFSYLPLALEAMRVLKDGSAFFVYTGWSTYPNHFLELVAAGFNVSEPLIVQKRPSGTTDLTGSFQTNSDWIMFAKKGRFKFRKTQLVRNKRAGTVPNKGRKPVPEFKTRMPSCWFGDEFPFSTENPAKKIPHPTPKSAELLSWLILLSTDKDALVVDPFVGSGATALACKMTGRKFTGCDIKPEFVELTRSRLK